MQGLNSDFISELMSSGRARNQYGPPTLEFLNSDEPGINPREVWPHLFASHKAPTLYQGFVTAVKKANLEDIILVKKKGEDVFLLHKERVTLAIAAAQDAANDNEE